MVLSDDLFRQFSDLVYQSSGINLHEGKRALLQARLNKRLRATGLRSYASYYNYLASGDDSQEFVNFLDCISTNLTYFFRESQHFDMLDKLLPELLETRKRAGNHRLRIWCAGCSTGEEPYSVAMCVLPHLESHPQVDFRILATDISTKALQVATQGTYGQERVEKVPEPLRRTYFVKSRTDQGSTHYEIGPPLRRIVTFRRLNLKDSYPFKGPFDFVFCRNVMIYFDKPTQENLVQRISQYLAPGGYLFVGHSESLMSLKHSLQYVCPAVYRKLADACAG